MTQITNLKKFYINKCVTKMRSIDKLKEIGIKNCRCYHLNNIIKTKDFALDNI